MKVNHEQTKNKILDICRVLRDQANYAKAFRQESKKVIDDEMLAQKYKNDKLAQLREAYNAKYNETKDKVVKMLGEIAEIELEQEKILELDVPEFSNTLATINAAQGKLPADVIEGIKLNFAGQYQALLAIKAAFERYEIDLKHYGYDEYTTSVAFAIKPLENAAANIEQDEVSTVLSLKRLFDDVLKFGKIRGVTFTPDQETFGEFDEEEENLLARRAMGLID